MGDRTLYRLGDIVDAVDKIDLLLKQKTFCDLQADPFLRAAFERFLEILSEASRHIPPEMKQTAPDMPWRRAVAGLVEVGRQFAAVDGRDVAVAEFLVTRRLSRQPENFTLTPRWRK